MSAETDHAIILCIRFCFRNTSVFFILILKFIDSDQQRSEKMLFLILFSSILIIVVIRFHNCVLTFDYTINMFHCDQDLFRLNESELIIADMEK